MEGHTRSLYGAEFSPDTSRVLTSANDGTVKLWDAENGREFLNIYGPKDRFSLIGAFFGKSAETVVIVKPEGTLEEIEVFPYLISDYSSLSESNLEKNIELWKRRRRVNEKVELKDIAW